MRTQRKLALLTTVVTVALFYTMLRPSNDELARLEGLTDPSATSGIGEVELEFISSTPSTTAPSNSNVESKTQPPQFSPPSVQPEKVDPTASPLRNRLRDATDGQDTPVEHGAARIVSNAVALSSLICSRADSVGEGSDSSRARQKHCSWFGRRRRDADDSLYVPTRIRRDEGRELDAANVTTDSAVLQSHEALHWRERWSLREPLTQWSLANVSGKKPHRGMPVEVLEEYETKHFHEMQEQRRPKVDGDLEFITSVPPLYFYRRPNLSRRWEAEYDSDHSSSRGSSSPQLRSNDGSVRIACLYAGFTRDAENMFLSCRDRHSDKYCSQRANAKEYGNMRKNIIETTNCDVYVSTWDIVGAGRYNTKTYDMTKVFDPKVLHRMYGERLAALHVQNFSEYQQLWEYMHKFSRPFPQTRPTKLHVDQHSGESKFDGTKEMNFFIRVNDYSQSYKHWVVAHMALLSDISYDIFFRLRFDLRATSQLQHFDFAYTASQLPPSGSRERFEREELSKTNVKRAVTFYMAKSGAVPFRSHNESSAMGSRLTSLGFNALHHVHAHRVHVGNFDIADFGFMGPPFVIEELSRVWYYCLALPATPLAPVDWTDVVTPSVKYSEYNLMLWRIIFDNEWEVDSGGRYLWVSRFGSRKKKGSRG